jgi:hypothetical protein
MNEGPRSFGLVASSHSLRAGFAHLVIGVLLVVVHLITGAGPPV